jgi:hypothetical protein
MEVGDLDPVGQVVKNALGLLRRVGSQMIRPLLVLGVDTSE